MKNQFYNTNQLYSVLPTDVQGTDVLAQLALDIRWSWNHAADELWEQIDPELWQLTHNPWIILQTASKTRLEAQLADPVIKKKISELLASKQEQLSKTAWFQRNHNDSDLKTVAYFSMEFMLSEALPIYVGGLGNVAGDQLKSASDLGVPVVAIGLMYQQGYFRQEIDEYGNQQALFPYNDPGQLPIMPLRLPNGEWLRLKINLSGHAVWLRTWQVQVGRNKLYLIDSNDTANLPIHREITNELYGGGSDLRIQQEILLGIGGWRLLKALGIKPEVCHMNEGHAAFLVLERVADLMKQINVPFAEALAITRAGNLFTTHTAVAAGFDYFSPSLMWQFFGDYAKDELGIDFNDLMALGRVYPNNLSESFNMANLAVRGSGAVNGVSNLHGEVSRHLFTYLFPRWPVEEVPVGSVTNGVHVPSWDSEFADELWTQACGKDRWMDNLETIESNLLKVSDESLWQLRTNARSKFVNYTRERFARQLRVSGRSPEIIAVAERLFDPNVLTLGFARRFVPYKRPNLLLHDEERFVRILKNYQAPVQIVIAGKSPPFDEAGKALIRQWIEFIDRYNLHQQAVFLSDYDMLLTKQMVQGVDVWLNTPRRPWEACGTSGMKVLVNGGLNLSELDGWWAEAYSPEVGWALGDVKEHGYDPEWDAAEAEALYDILEKQVIPEFYSRNEKAIPAKWIARMRKSMASLTPRFSANRTVREYTEKYYLPAAADYLKRLANNGAMGIEIVKDQLDFKMKSENIAFKKIEFQATNHGYLCKANIVLNGIDPDKIIVELYADGLVGNWPERIPMQLILQPGIDEESIFSAQIDTTRPNTDFTIRLFAKSQAFSVPLENNIIRWQH